MDTGKGLPPVEPIIISMITVLVGWVSGAVLYTYDQGKRQGTQNEKLANLEAQVTNMREDIKITLARFDGTFIDHNGNPRLMSVDTHHDICQRNHDLWAERFKRVIESIAKSEIDRLQRDNSLFDKLRELNDSVNKVAESTRRN